MILKLTILYNLFMIYELDICIYTNYIVNKHIIYGCVFNKPIIDFFNLVI